MIISKLQDVERYFITQLYLYHNLQKVIPME